MLEGKRILLGVTGGIAAYKAADLVSRLTQKGADVEVVMTASATRLVGPITFATLSHHEVHYDTFTDLTMPPLHIRLAQGRDLQIIAPLTANTMAKIAYGIADNLLTSAVLASTAPLLCAPAMNNVMWENPATRANVQTLKSRGVNFVGPVCGHLACGTTAIGKMAEPADILAAADALLA